MSAHRCASAFLDNEATEAVHNVGNEIDRFTAYDLGNGAPENTGKKKDESAAIHLPGTQGRELKKELTACHPGKE